MDRPYDRHVGPTTLERVSAGVRESVDDELAVEEPLEIRVDGEPLAVTMRTPGEDEELAVGFLAGEGLIGSRDEIAGVGLSEDLAANIIEVTTTSGLRRELASSERSFYLSSSCGVCGKGALEYVRVAAGQLGPSPAASIDPAAVLAAPQRAREAQVAFARTGGLHASSLFEPSGEIVVLREDVGRHNALDKAIGSLLLEGRYPLPGMFACLSGRVSFELMQKASLAGLSGVVAVGAPSTLAVELARERGILLCAFVRGGSFNVYAGGELLRA